MPSLVSDENYLEVHSHRKPMEGGQTMGNMDTRIIYKLGLVLLHSMVVTFCTDRRRDRAAGLRQERREPQ